ncbi:HET-domain-containing protein [Hyaloscypha variabilis F]|uniref:HET-domain-containing protein n=1 Tax=Hyaloscypha variabilis (strain UAMH 11265 / GT02V1 / F) TaxID=1149755 RepID=A0A2J6RR15_HYAVF|nr:HET-domain-containing protein [Hyaloscypha variabilis F]
MEKRAISRHKGRLERAKVPRISAKKQPKCDVCAKIVKLFRTPFPPPPIKNLRAFWTWVQLGSFEDVIVSTRCEIHPRMLRSVFGDALNTTDTTKFVAKGADDCIIIVGHNSEYRVSLDHSSLMRLPTPSAIHNAVSSCITHNAIAVNRQWIDSNLLRRWKRSCDKQNHAACRQWPQTSGLSLNMCPNWLIDTWRMCLVRGTTGVPYVALSYVWGPKEFFKTTRQNLDQLQLDGAFINSHQRLGVPRTIADAISVVGLLEERYLWVDALCIVQDDSITRHSEINKMASIFAGASITIIASQGEDANYGLRGLHSISQPRNLNQDIFALTKGYNIVNTRKKSKTPCVWANRGWTYQESLLARRRLCFGYDGIDWDCRCSSFHEDARANPGSKLLYRDTTRDMFSSPFPSLRGYGELLSSYNLRDFTYPEDALSAFAGITTSLSLTFYGGFVCGIPLMFLDIALCWQPSANVCERRLPSENTDKEPTELGLPSWSWVGWKCKPYLWAWEHGNDYVKQSPYLLQGMSCEETLPIVSWFSRKWGTAEATPISHFQGVIQGLKTSAIEGKEPPMGWKRFEHSINSGTQSVVDRSYLKNFERLGYFYRYEHDPNSEFWYPIPSWYDTQGDTSPCEIAGNTLLCARTRRASLWLTGRFKACGGTISIRDRQRNWVGALRLQTPLPMETSNRYSGEMIACELVAISAGYAIEGRPAHAIDEWFMPERPEASKGEKYEFYNVLWVEWKDGIAYRKALGRVMKSAWEAQDLEWIDLVLG